MWPLHWRYGRTNQLFTGLGGAQPPRLSAVWGMGGDPQGVLPECTILSAFSCKLTYPKSDSGLMVRAAHAKNGYMDMVMPAHYLSSFHINYTERKQLWRNMRTIGLLPPLTDDMTEFQFNKDPDPEESWAVLFWKILDARTGSLDKYRLPEFAKSIPTLSAWMLPDSFTGSLEDKLSGPQYQGPDIKLVRNPYYWKVDANNQQLPYFNAVTLNNAQAANWHASIAPFLIPGMPGYTSDDLIVDVNASNYLQYLTPRMLHTANTDRWAQDENNPFREFFDETTPVEVLTDYTLGLAFEYDNGDAAWIAAAQDKRFRQALSAAIDRQALCATVFNNHATPASWAPDAAILPDDYLNIDVPLLLDVQTVMPLEDQERLLAMIAANLQAIGLNAYPMNDTLSKQYQMKDDLSVRPALRLCVLPSARNMWDTDAHLVPTAWIHNCNNPPEVQDYVDAVAALNATAMDERLSAWQAIGDQIRVLQPFVPLVDDMQACVHALPLLGGYSGDTMDSLYHTAFQWYFNERPYHGQTNSMQHHQSS